MEDLCQADPLRGQRLIQTGTPLPLPSVKHSGEGQKAT
jgi:hypothetical protein